jgi:hypothetical protein
VAADVWDKEKGLPAINAKLDVIMERKRDYDKTVEDLVKIKTEEIGKIKGDIGKVKTKISVLTAIWGTISGIVGFVIGKVIDIIITRRNL